MFEKALEFNPLNAIAYYYCGLFSHFKQLGLSYYPLQSYEESLEMYDKAIETDPLYVKAYIDKCIHNSNKSAMVLIALEEFERALEMCDKSIELDPRADYYFTKGKI